MTDKIKRKIVLFFTLGVFALLLVVLGVINILSYAFVCSDADARLVKIADGGGVMTQSAAEQGNSGPLGPDSPETPDSARYFTYAFDGEDSVKVAFNMTAVSEENALKWASSLSGAKGWSKGVYRYFAYEISGVKYVSVLYCGDSWLSFYRTLISSVVALVLSTALAFGASLIAVKTYSHTIRDSLSGEEKPQADVSAILESKLGEYKPRFEEKGVALDVAVSPGAVTDGDAGNVETVIGEIISNALNFAKTKVSVTLSASDGRATFVCSNDADDLKDGRLDTIFEKGVKSDSSTGEGMGLNRVKEIVETRGGRAGAKAENGNFIIKVEF